MTLLVQQPRSQVWGKKFPQNKPSRTTKTAQALKRYLDLTLTGTKKSLAEHGRSGRKDHPLSPYTFDRPDVESSINATLQSQPRHTSPAQQGLSLAPGWVTVINKKVHKHSGEAPLFSENFLPMSKQEQRRPPESRPLSGISTKSAPVIIDGEMYYRPSRKHSYLQASNRPCSAKESRLTRASKLREKHRSQNMSVVPSNDTKLQLKRIKEMKPKPLHLNKDLMPIPCHTGETPHSFIIGARYNCSHFMDSRSYSRLGLYVPRQDPLRTFLKIYKGEEAYAESDSDFVGHTSVRPPASSGLKFPGNHRGPPTTGKPPVNPPHVRKVVKEAWLSGGVGKGSEVSKGNTQPPSRQSSLKKSSKPKQYKAPSTTPRSEKSRSPSRDKFNVQGQHVQASPDVITGQRSTGTKSANSTGRHRSIESRASTRPLNQSPKLAEQRSISKRQSIEAVLPSTD